MMVELKQDALRWKPRSGLLAWRGAARCPMSGVFWCGAVGTTAGPPVQGGMQILGGSSDPGTDWGDGVNCCRVLDWQMGLRSSLQRTTWCYVGISGQGLEWQFPFAPTRRFITQRTATHFYKTRKWSDRDTSIKPRRTIKVKAMDEGGGKRQSCKKLGCLTAWHTFSKRNHKERRWSFCNAGRFWKSMLKKRWRWRRGRLKSSWSVQVCDEVGVILKVEGIPERAPGSSFRQDAETCDATWN